MFMNRKLKKRQGISGSLVDTSNKNCLEKTKTGDNSKKELELSLKKQLEFKSLPLPLGIKRVNNGEQDKKLKETSKVMMAKMRIELIQSIGSGNYAEVYFGLNYNDCKQNAIKVIDLKMASANYKLKLLPRELKVLQRVKHRNIVNIYDMMQSDNKIFIVMEYAIGGTIADYVRNKGPIAEKDVQQIFKSILDGLRYMHALGIAHRDMKADNILLSKYFVPKLTDFSHSRNVQFDKDSNIKLSQTFSGSVPYFPPQILQLKPYHPLKYDIWSTGVVLYLMLFNAFPFNPENESQMILNQLNKNWHFIQPVSDLVKDVLNQMLEPEEEHRCNTSTLILHEWLRGVKPIIRMNDSN